MPDFQNLPDESLADELLTLLVKHWTPDDIQFWAARKRLLAEIRQFCWNVEFPDDRLSDATVKAVLRALMSYYALR